MSNRANLNIPQQKSPYLFFAICLFIFSLIGIFFLGRLNKSNDVDSPTPTPIPTSVEVEPSPVPEVSISPSLPSSPSITIKPTLTSTTTDTVDATVIVGPTNKITPSINLTPTPTFYTLTSNTHKFSVPYRSYRQLYQDKELSGDRYTLYYYQGNIAIHIGSGWSWFHPNRQFTDTFKIGGQNTFVYDIEKQKIVDFEYNNLKYTIQCVHNGIQSLKDECQRFLGDFKLL